MLSASDGWVRDSQRPSGGITAQLWHFRLGGIYVAGVY